MMIPQDIVWACEESQVVRDSDVEAVLAQMGPEERVGQLFLVTYYGSDVSEASEIATLISGYHVGGVVLLATNDNFSNSSDIPAQVHQLTNSLQTLAAGQSSLTATPELLEDSGPYIPLFIGLEHDGSGPPHSQLLSGLSILPSNMAIGATWNPDFAKSTGQVVGQELSVLGINLLLGPSADVVEVPQPFTSGDLGTRVFGGESFWVSQMTAAYMYGVHEGGSGRLAVVPRHFPGHGGADRSASVEVPTVRRSLDQLKQLDLMPFFAVTDSTKDPLFVADGLLTGHISYLGFQGNNPRVATRPVSLDGRPLQELLKLEPIASWRSNGGLIVSDSLGMRGVRRLYDRQEDTFPGRRIAHDALMAGNDLLYLSDFRKDVVANQTETIIDTLEYFVQTYQGDAAFKERVDDSVRRILRKKLDLYGGKFDIKAVKRFSSSEIAALGQHTEVASGVARSALTLLSSQSEPLESPQEGDRIVIFTDARTVLQCANCMPRPLIAVNALQLAILRLYGPQGSKQVTSSDVQSFPFEQLVSYLEHGPQQVAGTEEATPAPDNLSLALDAADWVVFVMLDVSAAVPSSSAVKQFLAVPPVEPGTRIVVMAMGAPYYLDSTEVAKLAAYYGLYGHTEPFVDVAARALFLGIPIAGASPVSVAGVNYNIVKATSPDPDQVIKLSYSQEGVSGETSTSVPVLTKGGVLLVSTGIIQDRNQRPVPDGTQVEFIQNYTNEGLSNAIPVTTFNGIAQASWKLDRAGELKITATSGDAVQSDTIGITVSDTGEVSIEVSSPDIRPTTTPTPTETPIPVTITPPPVDPEPEDVPVVGVGDLLLSLFGLGVIGTAVFVFGISRRNFNYGLLLALPTIIFGLIGYNYYVLLWPGAALWRSMLGDVFGAGTVTWIGALMGLGLITLTLYTLDRWPQASSVNWGDHR
ncbi:MAG: hypothetical protein JXB07_05605 [Anaerolineae bacterium]|nr:hypothetical protein [Anaerolineae bacterium]